MSLYDYLISHMHNINNNNSNNNDNNSNNSNNNENNNNNAYINCINTHIRNNRLCECYILYKL